MERLFIDIETRADESIKKLPGVYKYVEHLDPDYPILLFGYSRDINEPVQVVDLANGEQIPQDVADAMMDNSVEKWAFNAQFERICMSAGYFGMPTGTYLDPESWHCIATLAAECGLPMQLEACGTALGIDKQKLATGKELIPMFCEKSKSKQISIFESANISLFQGENWELFKEYNKRDVEAEIEIWQRCMAFRVRAWELEHRYYVADQHINDTGFLIDVDLANTCRSLAAENVDRLAARLTELTGLDNPRSNAAMKKYLAGRGIILSDEPDSDGTLDGTAIALELKKENLPDDLREILTLYGQITKTSSSKYDAMLKAASDADARARGCFVFYGASTTGRFSGKAVQLQNPTKNGSDVYELRAAAVEGPEALKAYSDKCGRPLSSLLSELVRTAIVPAEGYKFVDMDYAQIEARVLAWIANERWRIETFLQGKDIYSESASQALHIPVAKHGPNAGKRKVGKLLELACGYGGGNGALIRFLTKIYLTPTAVEGLATDDERNQMVTAWRNASPNIKTFWYVTDTALKTAFHQPDQWVWIERENYRDASKSLPAFCACRYDSKSGALAIHLPSGRNLIYQNFRCVPTMRKDASGKMVETENILYDRYEKGRWSTNDRVYGATFVENIVQATARDLLCDALIRVEALNQKPELRDLYEKLYGEPAPDVFIKAVATVHDEGLWEAPEKMVDVVAAEIKNIMSNPPQWALAAGQDPAKTDLPIAADGDILDYFCKPDDIVIPEEVLEQRKAIKEATEKVLADDRLPVEETPAPAPIPTPVPVQKQTSQLNKLFKNNSNVERS